jgi:hypothetical protein
VGQRIILDHLTRARILRDRAAQCRVSAKATLSAKFGDCYRLLADHYVILAKLEEDFVSRQNAAARDARIIAAE